MEIVPIFSGSNGNFNMLKTENGIILIDSGVSYKQISKVLENKQIDKNDILGLLVTHRHSDHIKGLQRFVNINCKMKVFAGTDVLNMIQATEIHVVEEKKFFEIHGIKVSPILLSHDVECYGYIFENGKKKCSYMTDTGNLSEENFQEINGSYQVMIEANYDQNMLEKGLYPNFLKNRISGNLGHLSNDQTKIICEKLLKNGTHEFILAHLSENNNTPEKAFKAVNDHLIECGANELYDYKLKVAKRYKIDG